MSYDLMVFDPATTPRGRAAFLDWYGARTWKEGHNYDDPAVSVPALRAWFMEAIASFPAMNGPFAPRNAGGAEPMDDTRFADYVVGRDAIYVAFAWSHAKEAYDLAFALARKHGVGLFDVSSAVGAVWWPDGAGQLILAHVDEAEQALKHRREALAAWVRTGEGTCETWLERPGGEPGAAEADTAAFERTAAAHRTALQSRLVVELTNPVAVAAAAAAWRSALGRMLTSKAPTVDAGARRAALMLFGTAKAGTGATETWRRLDLGDGWTLLYPAPSAARATFGLTVVLSGGSRHDFTARLSEVTSWLARSGHAVPKSLAETLLSAAASVVLGRDTQFHEGNLIEFRAVTASATSNPAEISLVEARAFDEGVNPGEELGFQSSFDAWLFPLLDWLHDAPSS